MELPGMHADMIDHLEKLIYRTVDNYYTPAGGFHGDAKLLAESCGIESGRRATLQKIDDLRRLVACGSIGDKTYPEIRDRLDRLTTYLNQVEKEVREKDFQLV